MTNVQIRFADALQRVFPTALASYLQFRDWIRQDFVRPKFGNI